MTLTRLKIGTFNLKTILEYLICFLLIYLSGSAVIATEEDSFLFRLLSILLILAVFFYELKYTKFVKALQKFFLYWELG